jgi:CheY-like chemotaxis protein
MLSRTIGEHVQLESKLSPWLWPVNADPTRLEQVIINLVVNARDAVTDTGTVVVATDNVELDDEVVALHAVANPGRYVRVTVADDGEGMTPETVARAFEPFFTTKPKGQGTGLGLATVYGIVNQLDGYVGIYSEPGHGTAVRVYIPAAEGAPREASKPVGPMECGLGEVVLVVEDDEQMRSLTSRILSKGGYAVVAADRGSAALALLEDPAARVDLLLSDVVMPEMSGQEVAERAAALRPGLPVLFMSGYAAGLVRPNATLPTGVDLLQKPFTQGSLLRAVAQALRRPSR